MDSYSGILPNWQNKFFAKRRRRPWALPCSVRVFPIGRNVGAISGEPALNPCSMSDTGETRRSNAGQLATALPPLSDLGSHAREVGAAPNTDMGCLEHRCGNARLSPRSLAFGTHHSSCAEAPAPNERSRAQYQSESALLWHGPAYLDMTPFQLRSAVLCIERAQGSAERSGNRGRRYRDCALDATEAATSEAIVNWAGRSRMW